MSEKPLLPQHDAFARLYVEYGVASTAYRKAGIAGKDTTPESVWMAASRLLTDDKVRMRVEHYAKIAAARWDSSVAKIAEQMGMMAYRDAREIHDANGAILPPEDWPAHVARTVQGIEVFEEKDADGLVIGHTKKVKFESRSAALGMLAKWKGMAIDRTEVGAVGEFDHLSDDEVRAIYQREVAAKAPKPAATPAPKKKPGRK